MYILQFPHPNKNGLDTPVVVKQGDIPPHEYFLYSEFITKNELIL